MTRIIGGTLSGRGLVVPARGTRPTSERVREALFSSLEAMLRAAGYEWSQIDVLDCFAGSGALGIEALSRGARRAVLVERSRSAGAVIGRNIAQLEVSGAEVVICDVLAASAVGRLRGPFGVLLADPPYDSDPGDIGALLTRIVDAGLLVDPGIIVIEGSRRWTASPLPSCTIEVRRRDYGDTALWYGRTA